MVSFFPSLLPKPMVTNWSIVSIWESVAGWIMGYDNQGYVLHPTASSSRIVCGAAIGLVFKLDPGEKLFSGHGKT
jgi:hypothetical protein